MTIGKPGRSHQILSLLVPWSWILASRIMRNNCLSRSTCGTFLCSSSKLIHMYTLQLQKTGAVSQVLISQPLSATGGCRLDTPHLGTAAHPTIPAWANPRKTLLLQSLWAPPKVLCLLGETHLCHSLWKRPQSLNKGMAPPLKASKKMNLELDSQHKL